MPFTMVSESPDTFALARAKVGEIISSKPPESIKNNTGSESFTRELRGHAQNEALPCTISSPGRCTGRTTAVRRPRQNPTRIALSRAWRQSADNSTCNALQELQRARSEHAQSHRDLPGMINRVLHDSIEHRFAGIAAPQNLLRQISHWKIPDPFFEQVATLVPAGDEFIPGNRRFGPFLFGLPRRERIGAGDISNSFIPKEQMLKERRNRMSPWNGRRHGKFRRNLS